MHVYSVWVLHDLFVFFVKTTCYHPDIPLRYLWNHANHITLITPCLLCILLRDFLFCVVWRHKGACLDSHSLMLNWWWVSTLWINHVESAVRNMETQKAEATCISSLITGLQSHCALQSLWSVLQLSDLQVINSRLLLWAKSIPRLLKSHLNILDHLNVRHTLSEALANSLKSVQP